jgi:2-keto-4-pentenoate hydratase/2-oxohepta-3-ene-1,7-dioic acid hydratase in catechol pathway
MKLATVHARGKTRCGIVLHDGFVDLSTRVADGIDLPTLLARGLLDEARAVAADAQPDFALDELRFLPPNARADMRMFALGFAYRAHVDEAGAAPPAHPMVFAKQQQSLVGHGENIMRPRASASFDFEGEICIVIGKGGRAIPASQARDHIAGYCLLMDGSVRDFQQHSLQAGKNFDASSSCGPWLVTADEAGDPLAMVLTTRLNGDVVQHCGFDQMLWDIGGLIAYLSTITHLAPGDVIATGTPAGVGALRNPPLFMKPGDVIEVEATGLGILRNTVIQES